MPDATTKMRSTLTTTTTFSTTSAATPAAIRAKAATTKAMPDRKGNLIYVKKRFRLERYFKERKFFFVERQFAMGHSQAQ